MRFRVGGEAQNVFPVARSTALGLGLRALGGVALEELPDDVTELFIDRDGTTFGWLEADEDRVRLRLLSRLEDDTLIETTNGDPGDGARRLAAGWSVVGADPDDWRAVLVVHHDRLAGDAQTRGAASVQLSLVAAADALERRALVLEGPARVTQAVAGVATGVWAVSLPLVMVLPAALLLPMVGALGALAVAAMAMVSTWAFGIAGLMAWSRIVGPAVGALIPFPLRRRVGGGDVRNNPFS